MTNEVEEIIKILDSRCYEQGGGCYNCAFRPLYSESHPSCKCLLLELKQLFNLK